MNGWFHWRKRTCRYMLQVVFMNLLIELGEKERKSTFSAAVHKVASPFTGIDIFSYEGLNGGVNYELLVG